jgi:hypothetical protein
MEECNGLRVSRAPNLPGWSHRPVRGQRTMETVGYRSAFNGYGGDFPGSGAFGWKTLKVDFRVPPPRLIRKTVPPHHRSFSYVGVTQQSCRNGRFLSTISRCPRCVDRAGLATKTQIRTKSGVQYFGIQVSDLPAIKQRLQRRRRDFRKGGGSN